MQDFIIRLRVWLDSLRSDEEGQGLAEYALILALVGTVAVVGLTFIGGQIGDILSSIGASLSIPTP
jgi:Flp pilus assembly pilin Flp